MNDRERVRKEIERVGIVPVVRASSADEARLATQAVAEGGIPIVEITLTVPGAVALIADLVRHAAGVLVGAGTILDIKTARQCLDAGAQFLVCPGFDPETIKLANTEGVTIIAGALTPTEVINAWRAGADLIKIFPCAQVGGPSYIKALKGPLPQVSLLPTGGVNLATIRDFLYAGAAALGVGGELIQKEALQSREPSIISQLARQYAEAVNSVRSLQLQD